MSAARTEFKGWNLTEAADRCLDPILRERRDEALESWRRAGSRTRRPQVYSFWQNDGESHARERSAKEQEGWNTYVVLKAVIRECDGFTRNLLLNGRLCGWGRVGQPTVELKPLPSAAWKHLKFTRDPSVLLQPDGTKIYDVTIFPPVHDEQAVSNITKLSLSEAFLRFVLRDPEVEKLGAIVVRLFGHESVFKQGRSPGPVVNYRWRLANSPQELARDFIRTGVVVLGGREEPIPEQIEALSLALYDRILALRDLLSSGRWVAHGTFVKTGVVQSIDPALWSRDTVHIDVNNGDFLDQIDGELVVSWASVALARPETAAVVDAVSAGTNVTKVVSSNKAKSQCIAWLAEEMRKSSDFKPKPRDQWWPEARRRFGQGLSFRAFKDAWADAVRQTGAHAWSAAGAPRKSA